ncbi:hypothetical protein U27_02622 [Candidatus Vecturithrix granuli]|uniref:Uncharacterized protein n=1 Tax=Vecturithrix granuli TaxID=1499967 RepID=A0A081CB34_VECG1|nr:hypothetical protein U27_02622 [Candidatus Vecturithrix granuli]
MHPANHGVKHKFIMGNVGVACDGSDKPIVGYLTFDTPNIVHFNAYGNNSSNPRPSIYSPLTVRYRAKHYFDPTKTKMMNAILYKADRFVLVY